MTLRVHVIGLGGQRPSAEFRDLLRYRPVIARAEAPARDWLAGDVDLTGACDDLFDNHAPGAIPSRVADQVKALADSAGECVYLVPASGRFGDETVAALSERFEVELKPGVIDQSSVLPDVQIVDALALAIAEEQFPFDAGLAAPDPARSLVVTNMRGAAVVPLATRRLQRLFGTGDFVPDRTGHLLLEPRTEPGAVRSFGGLERIVATLRSPAGCPWDREQTPETLVPMMLEEIDELRDALASNPALDQADELGDVLLHIAMIAQIAREQLGFTIEDVLAAITAKMVRRHPHVFGDVRVSSIEELYQVWQDVKESERAGEPSGSSDAVSRG